MRGSKGLTSMLRDLFMTFGIPEELASDGGPEFTAAETQKFLNTTGGHPWATHMPIRGLRWG